MVGSSPTRGASSTAGRGGNFGPVVELLLAPSDYLVWSLAFQAGGGRFETDTGCKASQVSARSCC